MSAFQVLPETINRIVALIERAHFSREGTLMCVQPPATLDTHEKRTEYGQRLVELNARALVVRYGDTMDTNPYGKPYEYQQPLSAVRPAWIWQALKSLDCYLYQCSEGDVVKESLYQSITTLRDALRSALVSSLPEYKAAQWE